jgi:hypothetical protein
VCKLRLNVAMRNAKKVVEVFSPSNHTAHRTALGECGQSRGKPVSCPLTLSYCHSGSMPRPLVIHAIVVDILQRHNPILIVMNLVQWLQCPVHRKTFPLGTKQVRHIRIRTPLSECGKYSIGMRFVPKRRRLTSSRILKAKSAPCSPSICILSTVNA